MQFNEMVSLAVALSAPLGRNKHCTIAAFIVLGLVTYLGVIGRTSKQVQSPSSHPLTPNPLIGEHGPRGGNRTNEDTC